MYTVVQQHSNDRTLVIRYSVKKRYLWFKAQERKQLTKYGHTLRHDTPTYAFQLNPASNIKTTSPTAHRHGRNGTWNDRTPESRVCIV
jgi:hypothetical protein